MDGNYSFGAGGFKLGDRVEILTTRQRGILICEMVHLSGCNTYQILLPKVPGMFQKEKMKTAIYDYLLLRKLETNEAIFGESDDLTDENVFSPKGTDVNAEWVLSAIRDEKEPLPEIDEGVGVDEIKIKPGTEIWHKVYSKKMLVYFICRDIYAKELIYGLSYMEGDKEISINAHSYALIPLEQRINLFTPESEKVGPVSNILESDEGVFAEDFIRYGGSAELVR